MITENVTRRAAVSNPKVAERLGLHFTMASRLRSGARLPSIPMMAKIEATFGWSIAEQIKVRVSNTQTYHEEFEAVLVKEYGSE